MSEQTAIEWCDSTFNPWIGCTKVSPGCDHCYAENLMATRWRRVQWGPGAPRQRTSEANWRQPITWSNGAAAFQAKHGRRRRVFCASLADVFDNEVPDEWRSDLFALIHDTPNLDWLLLTKRIGNAKQMMRAALYGRARDIGALPLDNVWLGISVVNQAEADRDIPKLLATPAAVRWISAEPLLGPMRLTPHLAPHCARHKGSLADDGKCDVCEGRGIWDLGDRGLAANDKAETRRGVDWVVAGGESGPGARPMHPDWARSLRDQCAAAGVPFLFKQWGEWEIASAANGHHDSDMARNAAHWVDIDGSLHKPSSIGLASPWAMVKVGKRAAGRVLDGVLHDGYPEQRA